MATDYRVDVYDVSGNLQYLLTDYLQMAYKINVNSPGMGVITIAGDHSLLSSLADKWQFEIWRRPEGQSWSREFVGFYRDIDWDYSDRSIAEIRCNGIMNMLGWRIVNWSAGVTNRTEFTSDPAETIMKTLVDYNAGANATTGNGRKRNGTITGLSVEADGANGNSLNFYCHGQNLLDALQELSLIGGGDFDLVKTSSTTYEFRWYTGQLGTDRTSTMVFSMDYGNMGRPAYKEQRSKEKTVACVYGQGVGVNRDYVTRTSAEYSASNDHEIFVDARDVTEGDTTGLQDRGDKKLAEQKIIREFSFETLETPASLYGVHYFLGDKIVAVNPYNDTSYTLKITSMNVSHKSMGDESIEPDFTSVM